MEIDYTIFENLEKNLRQFQTDIEDSRPFWDDVVSEKFNRFLIEPHLDEASSFIFETDKFFHYLDDFMDKANSI